MRNIKIGITSGLKDNTESIWTNGIKQNILVLARLLRNSDNKYDVSLLNVYDVDFNEKRPSYLNDVNIHFFDTKYEEMDIIIVMGAQIDLEKIKKFKALPNKKLISYKCGSNYILTMESVLFKEDTTSKSIEHELLYDEVWYIPQQHETNCGYYKTLHRTNIVQVPFIWHNKYLVESILDIEKGFKAGTFKKSYKYDPTKEKKYIGILEPNLNIVKFCLIPSMIAEESYRTEIGKNKIDKLMITNSTNVVKNGDFMSILQSFDLYKDGKILGESRYQTAYILTQYIDILVCHQILNPLNYLYLDAAYMGYPVLHNAYMCKDIGYYYEGSDTVEGAKMLNWVLENHDNNIDEYNKKTMKVLDRYYADNKKLIETYDKLIEGLYDGSNVGLVYDVETNLYK